MNELTEEQTKAAIEANKLGFITHSMAMGKTAEEAQSLLKRASARAERRGELAKTILASLEGK